MERLNHSVNFQLRGTYPGAPAFTERAQQQLHEMVWPNGEESVYDLSDVPGMVEVTIW